MKNRYAISVNALAKILFTVALAAICGCSSPALKSKRVTNGNKTATGVSYFLPKVMVQITADALRVPQGLQTNRTYWATNIYTEIVADTNGNKTPITNSILISGSSSATGDNVVIDTNNYSVEIKLLTVPDPEHLYALKLKPSAAANDKYSVTVNPNGFLTSVNSSNEDRTGPIIETIGQTAINVMEAVGTMGRHMANTNPGTLPSPPPAHFEVIFDPTSEADLDRATLAMRSGVKQLITVDCQMLVTNSKCPLTARTNCGPKETGGVFYRPALPYLLSVQSGVGGKGTNYETLVMLPNEAPVFSVPVRRQPFVGVDTAITFTNGFISSLDYTKPSQIEGFVAIPFDLSKMVLSIPTNLIQFKVNIATAQTSLLKQQQALADQQTTLLNSMSNLMSAQERFNQFVKTNK